MAIRFVTITGFLNGDLLYTPDSLIDFRRTGYPPLNDLYTEGANILSMIAQDNTMYTIYDNDIFKIVAESRSNKYMLYFYIYYNGNMIETIPVSASGDTPLIYCGACFAVDDDTEMGNIFFLSQSNYYGSYDIYLTSGSVSPTNDKYLAITGSEQPLYTWQSVPAISGKNGILSLPTLVDTDGEPISGQSASAFSSLPEGSNVRTLINGAL